MLLAVDLDEYFIDVEGITVALVLSLQSSSVYRSEFDTPQPDGFIADSDASFCQEIFDITVAEIESIVEPNCVADDVWGRLGAEIGGAYMYSCWDCLPDEFKLTAPKNFLRVANSDATVDQQCGTRDKTGRGQNQAQGGMCHFFRISIAS